MIYLKNLVLGLPISRKKYIYLPIARRYFDAPIKTKFSPKVGRLMHERGHNKNCRIIPGLLVLFGVVRDNTIRKVNLTKAWISDQVFCLRKSEKYGK